MSEITSNTKVDLEGLAYLDATFQIEYKCTLATRNYVKENDPEVYTVLTNLERFSVAFSF